MNQERRNSLQKILDEVYSILDDLDGLEARLDKQWMSLEAISEAEEAYRYNIHANLQNLERYERAEKICDTLDDVINDFNDAHDSIESVAGTLTEITSCIKTAMMTM